LLRGFFLGLFFLTPSDCFLAAFFHQFLLKLNVVDHGSCWGHWLHLAAAWDLGCGVRYGR
jgi:hypothetical protein